MKIKYAGIIFFMALFLSGQALATNYYFDLASGNDTTGDGTYGNPWKTIDKCTTSRSGGDECRGAKTTVTTLDGTLTFTNGSTSVATSADLTAVVAAGDLVGKNSGLEGWWKVASLTSSAITLSYQYWGLSGSGSAVTAYKITPVTASEQYDVAVSGTSTSSRLKISGGWTLATQAQDGITAFASSYANAISLSTKNYVEISKFIISSTSSYGINNNSNYGCYFHDLWVHGAISIGLLFNAGSETARHVITDVVVIGGTGDGVATLYSDMTNVYAFSVGTGTGDVGFDITSRVVGRNLRAYNAYDVGIYFSQGYFNFVDGAIIDSVTRGGSKNGIRFYYGSNNRVYDLTISNCTYNFGSDSYSSGNFITGTIGAAVTAETSFTGVFSLSDPIVTVQPTGSDSIMYYANGTIEHDSSADCVSGLCLKFSPTSSTLPVIYKVGTVKIPSADSDLTVYAKLKDDASFDGTVKYLVVKNGQHISETSKTPTTTYVSESVVVGSSDLIANEYIDLYVIVTGTAGSIWIDDFSASQ